MSSFEHIYFDELAWQSTDSDPLVSSSTDIFFADNFKLELR